MADVKLTYSLEASKGGTRQIERDMRKTADLAGFSDQLVKKRFKQPLGKIRGELGEFQKSMEASNARVIAFGASTAAIAGVATALKGIAKASIDVQRSLTDINVILNTTRKGLHDFGQELFKIAANTGQSFQVVAEAAGELARQGLSMEDTLQRTSDALILARLSGMDTVDAVNSLTAAVNSFSKSALNSTEIVNKLANVDAAFAVSSADLAEAIKRVGSSASDAGVSMDQLIAIVTAAQQTTARGGAVIGNSFKTIFTRLQRPAVLDQLTQLGIATKDASGNILPLIGVLQGLAKNFDKLEDTQKSQIAELVGGVFQVNVLKAALSDLSNEYGVMARAQEISASSTNEAIKRNEQLNQTLSTLINRTFVNLQNVGSQIGDIAFAPNAGNILKSFNELLEGSTNVKTGESIGDSLGRGVIKGLGNFFLGGPGLMLGALGIFKLFKQLGKFSMDAFKGITELDKSAQRRAATEARINALLESDKNLLRDIASGNTSAADAADKIYQSYLNQERVLNRIQSKVKGAATKLSGTSLGKTSAMGFMPNFSGSAQERLAMLAAGYNPSDVRTASVRKARIYDGSGGSFSSSVNSKETVRTGTNAAGYRATFVVPPKSSAAYGNYVKNIPNFAKIDPHSLDFDSAALRGINRGSSSTSTGQEIAKALNIKSSSHYGGSRRIAEAFYSHHNPKRTGFEAASKTDLAKINAIFKKHGIKGPLNVSALAFPDIGGPIQKGLLNMVGTPFNLGGFNTAFNAGYPSFISNVGQGAVKGANPKLAGAFANKLKSVTANDKVGNAQVRGRVHEVIASALLQDPKSMGNKLVDIGEGAKLDPNLASLVTPAFGKGLSSGGVELKGGTFRMGDIVKKFGLEGDAHKAFIQDLNKAGIKTGSGPFRKKNLGGGVTISSGSGFIPNFSAKSKAMSTERSMGGSPEFRTFPFPHVADRRTQKDFGDVMRSHPEGLGKAIKNSFEMQGVPNFATNPFSKMFGGVKEGLQTSKKALFGTLALDQASEKLEKVVKSLLTFDNALQRNESELESYRTAIERGTPDAFKEAGLVRGGETVHTGSSSGKVLKGSKVYKRALEEASKRESNIAALNKEIEKAKKKQLTSAKERDRLEQKAQKSDRLRSKAFSFSFLAPMVVTPLLEAMNLDAVDDAFSNNLLGAVSSAATAMSIIEGPAGKAVGALVFLGASAGAFTNWFANVGEGLAETVDELKSGVTKLQNASDRYFDIAQKLDSAIKSGAQGNIIARLNTKLLETLSKLDPAQQALLVSSMSLAEKQDAMAEIIDKQARTLKKAETAQSVAASINEARGMGIGSFFSGVGSAMGGGTFREGANDVNAITGAKVGGFASEIFANVGPSALRGAMKTGGLSSGNFLNTLSQSAPNDAGMSALISSLRELNDEGLDGLRLAILKVTQEAERNIKVAEQLTRVQKQYRFVLSQSVKLQKDASDALVTTQKRLVDNFVFNRQMQSNEIFGKIDTNIAKFDALFGATAQNLDMFQKADLNYRKKKLVSEVEFNKKIFELQQSLISDSSDIASVTTGIKQSPTDKKAATRRGESQVEASRQFTEVLRKFSKTQDVESFNRGIANVLKGQGDDAKKDRSKQENAFTALIHGAQEAQQQRQDQLNSAEQILKIEKEQAKLLRAGGIQSVIDPASFEKMQNSMTNAMEDIFLGSGGARGALGVNDLQAGSGFLNLIKNMRAQGFDTKAMIGSNPALIQQATNARAGQIRSQASDLGLLASLTGDGALGKIAREMFQNADKLAGDQVQAFVNGENEMTKILDETQALLIQQGSTFNAGITEVRKILQNNVTAQQRTFNKLETAAKNLEAASLSLSIFQKLRESDPTGSKAAAEAAQKKIADAQNRAGQASGAAGRQIAKGIFGGGRFGDAPLFGGSGMHLSYEAGRRSAGRALDIFGVNPLGFGSGGAGRGRVATGLHQMGNYTWNQGGQMLTKMLTGEGLLAKTAAQKSAGIVDMQLFGSQDKETQKKFISEYVLGLAKSGIIKEQDSRDLEKEFTSGFFNINQLFSGLDSIAKEFSATKIFTDSMRDVAAGQQEYINAMGTAIAQTKQQAAAVEQFKKESSERGLDPITGTSIDTILKRASEGLGQHSPNAEQNMFEVAKSIFEPLTQINATDTPFVSAAREISEASKKGFQVQIGEAKVEITGGEQLKTAVKDAASAAVAESVTKAMGQMAGLFGGVNEAIKLISANMPPKTKQMINNIRINKEYEQNWRNQNALNNN